uniref:Rho-GAP domain-containing protein n=1 Tax=Seriola dumerili TaxID=41447 RepID=A0A3B4TPV3_SERDU
MLTYSKMNSSFSKTRGEFENDGNPDLNKDVYLQDIHCVSSLCKAYFRELPNPLLTYQLKGSLKGRKWMSIFNIGGRFPDPRRRHKHSAKGTKPSHVPFSQKLIKLLKTDDHNLLQFL